MGPDRPDFLPPVRGALTAHIPLPPRRARIPAYVPAPGDHRLGSALEGGGVVALSAAGRRAHTHILGGSGRGKSYFLQHLIRQDFEDPDCGLCLLDPHGSLYHPLVRYLATERPELASRVVLFDPAGSGGYIPGFNPIGPYAFQFPEYTLNTLVNACLKAWGQDKPERTPRITRQLENIFAPIIANGLTLIETAPLISTSRHSEKRALLLAALDHELIQEEWATFEAATATVRQQLLEGAGNRLRRFLSNGVIRQVLGRQERVIDIDRIIAEKKILLVNLAPGMHIDRDNVNLLGILLITELFRAAMLRNPDTDPHPFYLYIDEFAQLITPTMANILDECRKFGLFLVLAHQHLAQLTREDDWLAASILANCHNRFVFGGLAIDDAELLARQVYTGFEDMKQIKHTEWQTKFRPVEEERVVRSRGRAENLGWSEMFTETSGSATARSRSIAEAIGRSQSHALARSQSLGRQESNGRSLILTTQLGGQKSSGLSRQQGRTLSHNWSNGRSEQESSGRSDGITSQESSQRGYQEPGGGRPEGSTRALTTADGTSSQQQASRALTATHQDGGGESLNQSEGETRTAGQSWSDSQAQGASRQQGVSRNTGLTATDTDTRSLTRTETSGLTETESQQQSQGQGRSGSESESESESIVPFHRMEEFREAKLTFWSAQEIELMRTGQLKEQPTGVATAKLGAAAPVRITVDTLTPVPYRAGVTEVAVEAFARRVARAFPEFYATPEEVREEISRRQLAIFGEVMRLDLKPVQRGLATQAIDQPAAKSVPPRLPPDTASSPPPPDDGSSSGGFSDDDDDA